MASLDFRTSYLVPKKIFDSLINKNKTTEQKKHEESEAEEEKTELMRMRDMLKSTASSSKDKSSGKEKEKEAEMSSKRKIKSSSSDEQRIQKIAKYFGSDIKGDVILLLEHISQKLWRDTLRWDEKNYNVIAFNSIIPDSNVVHVLKYLYAPLSPPKERKQGDDDDDDDDAGDDRYSEETRLMNMPKGTVEFLEALGDDPELGADAWGMNPLRYDRVLFEVRALQQAALNRYDVDDVETELDHLSSLPPTSRRSMGGVIQEMAEAAIQQAVAKATAKAAADAAAAAAAAAAAVAPAPAPAPAPPSPPRAAAQAADPAVQVPPIQLPDAAATPPPPPPRVEAPRSPVVDADQPLVPPAQEAAAAVKQEEKKPIKIEVPKKRKQPAKKETAKKVKKKDDTDTETDDDWHDTLENQLENKLLTVKPTRKTRIGSGSISRVHYPK